MEEYKPFENLKKAKLKLKPSRTEQLLAELEAAKKRAAQEKAAQVNPEDDLEAFQQAMGGVKPLDRKVGGRELAPEVGAPASPAQVGSEDDEVRDRLTDLIEGKVEFELENTDEYLQGHVAGLDPKVFRQLKNGKLSCEAHLDLHGMNSEQAYRALLEFIREHYQQGRRCLLVIPGRGRNSPGGMGVLKTELQSWLTRDPLRRIVLAFTTALPKHGGAGALYVLLRKFRKTQGKVFWDRDFPDL